MKEPKVENTVKELKETVVQLNKLTELLNKTGTTFHLHRATKDGEFILMDVQQKVEY